MTILFITHYNALYGANKSLINLIDGLLNSKNELKIILIAPEGAICEEVRKRGVEVFEVPFYNEIYTGKKNRFSVKSVVKNLINWGIAIFCYAKLRKRNIDIVHTNSSMTFIGAYLSFLLNRRHVWHIREYGLEDYNIKYTFGLKYFHYWIRRAFGVISVSFSLAHARLENLKLKKLAVIYNGVIMSDEITESTPQIDASEVVIFAIVGFVSREKGQWEALKAFSLLYKTNKNIKLYIIGDGFEWELKELRNFVASKGLGGCVEFKGYVKDIDFFYKQIHILLMCSRHEALGRVTIEAMAKGIVVIGYNNGGTSEILTDGVNGFLYSSDYKELSSKMLYIIEENLSVRTNISINAKYTVKQKYTIEQYSKEVLSFYYS